MLTTIFAVAFFCLCLQAAITDTLTFKIPNWMNLTFIILFVPAAFAANIGWGTAGSHILVGLVALVASFGLFSFNLFGGGDAKMIPGVLLWLGPTEMLERKKEIPYGVAIAAGAFMAAGQSPLLISFIKQISGTN